MRTFLTFNWKIIIENENPQLFAHLSFWVGSQAQALLIGGFFFAWAQKLLYEIHSLEHCRNWSNLRLKLITMLESIPNKQGWISSWVVISIFSLHDENNLLSSIYNFFRFSSLLHYFDQAQHKMLKCTWQSQWRYQEEYNTFFTRKNCCNWIHCLRIMPTWAWKLKDMLKLF